MRTSKYLYISKSRQYGKLNARMTSTKGSTAKGEIYIKLNIDVPHDAFIDNTPTATIEVPKDYKKKTINLRVE